MSSHPDPKPIDSLLDEMIAFRQQVCTEHALTIDHKHCIGCLLVMDHMQKNHPNMVYGSEDQWVQESAFCAWHEREIFKEFLRQRGINL